MSDIFISYASADRGRAKMLADALAEHGWSVWWDRVIPPGKQFDEVIEEALDAAKCVVVLWSTASAASTWVKTEAAEAMRRKALIPAIIEDVKIPLEFRRLQAADLSRWTGDPADPQLAQFFQSIETEVRRSAAPLTAPLDVVEAAAVTPAVRAEPAPAPRTAPATEARTAARRKLSPAVLGAIAAIVVALLGAGIYYEHAKSVAEAERAGRMKAAQEQEEREKAREKAAREDTARASKADEERKGRQQAPAVAARGNTPPASRAPQPVPTSGILNLQWRDHALGYSGNLSWNPASALFQVAVIDLRTGTRLGNFAVPALIAQQAPMEYIVSGQFAVGGDSTTAGPHVHTSRLLLRAQQDGSLRFVRNCPQPGECY